MAHASLYVESRHFYKRKSQRGFSSGDIDLLEQYGEDVDDGLVMTSKAIEEARRSLKSQLQRLSHLKNVALIQCNSTRITIYYAGNRTMRQLIEGTRK